MRACSRALLWYANPVYSDTLIWPIQTKKKTLYWYVRPEMAMPMGTVPIAISGLTSQ